ncbi:MAG TPA: MerR family transcriptional regulator [Candidatus Limnocylindrales bacterium]|jgi:MerR family transcriptional regulator/heat shock protein HspR
MQRRLERDPSRPVYVISVAAEIVSVHPRTLRIYEDEGLLCPARTPTNIRLYSENDVRRVLWIRHLTRDRGINLAGVRILFELEERLGKRILEALFDEGIRESEARAEEAVRSAYRAGPTGDDHGKDPATDLASTATTGASTPATTLASTPATTGRRPRQ